jgi:hypothetical protein
MDHLKLVGFLLAAMLAGPAAQGAVSAPQAAVWQQAQEPETKPAEGGGEPPPAIEEEPDCD